jgi:Fic/DOC family
MLVVSGAIYAPKVHRKAPPSSRVKFEMHRFIAWAQPNGTGRPRAVARTDQSGDCASFDYESVHPFEDGNGRIGCALAEKTLARASANQRSSRWPRRFSPSARAITRQLKQPTSTMKYPPG